MCGIAGILGSNAAEHEKAVHKMVAAMPHRGPDGEGIYISPSGTCILGHRRLAILDLSDAASQPMISTDGNFVLVYNGECYNFRELRDRLSNDSFSFVSSGDTEVVLKLLQKEGVAALPKLNAMFALALWNERKQTLLMARDRYGQKPLYFTRIGKLLLFASEVRALLASGLVPRKADLAAIHSYLAYGAVQEPNTIVAGISILKPAGYMLCKPDGTQNYDIYWRYSKREKKLSPQELRNNFISAVHRHLISDAPLGLFLSGGIDSSSVVAAATRRSKTRIKTLNVTFPEQPDESEAEYAGKMAEWTGTEHFQIPVTGQQLLQMLPEALDAMDQPTGDAINTYLISHAASQTGLKAVLSGVGGDELFGGYHLFRDVPKMLAMRRFLSLIRKPAAYLLGKCNLFALKPAKLADFFDAPANILNYYLVRRRIFSWRQIREIAPELVKPEWDSALDNEYFQDLQTLIDGSKIHDAVGRLEMRAYMGQTLLRDSDVMGMAHGLEIRLPFLDSEFSIGSLNLEPESRIPQNTPKARFVEAMGDWLPDCIANRPKHGFTLPFENWMLNEMKNEIIDGINSFHRLGNLIQRDTVLNIWQKFCTKPKKIGWFRLWSLFVLGHYLEIHKLEVR